MQKVKINTCSHIPSTYKPKVFLNQTLKDSWVCLYVDHYYSYRMDVYRLNAKQIAMIYHHKSPKQKKAQQNILFSSILKHYKYTASNELNPSYIPSLQKQKKVSRSQSVNKLRSNEQIQSNIMIYYRERWMKKEKQCPVIFCSNVEYPQSFQKQNQGLCGLKQNTLTSYLNCVVQFISHIPIFASILNQLSNDHDNKPLILLQIICKKILSGKFRCLKIEELHQELLKLNQNFYSYQHKTAEKFLYEIMKWMSNELSFRELQCKQGQIIDAVYHQWMDSQQCIRYSPLKQILSGCFILRGKCSQCLQDRISKNNFECLKLSITNEYYSTKLQFEKLIENSFTPNLKNPFTRSNCVKCNIPHKVDDYDLQLPNILLMEFGQDLEGLQVELPPKIDLNCYVSKDKVIENAYIYEYLGSISKQFRGKYFTNMIHNGKLYYFCDSIVQEAERIPNKIKITAYKRIRNPKLQPISHNIQSSISLAVNNIIPIPDFWNFYLKYNSKIPPLMNPFICSHGCIKLDLKSKMKGGAKKLPVEVYQYLLQKFGGRKISNENLICQRCSLQISTLAKIRQIERQMARFTDQRSQKKKNKVLIHIEWLKKWQKFLYEYKKSPYTLLGYCRPSKITNKKGFSSSQKNQINQEEYKKISYEVWYFLKKFYGGGPLIPVGQFSANQCKNPSNVKNVVDEKFIQLKELINDFES